MRATTTTGTKNIGIWVRVSTEDQVKGDSPEHHERRATGVR
jgi:site-specific DNA recombinase